MTTAATKRFDPSGSRYFTFTAAWTYDPEPLAWRLHRLRFGLLRDGHGIERFHAALDRRWVRDRVFGAMEAVEGWQFASVIVDKTRLYDPLRFYPQFLSIVLRFVLRGRLRPGTDRVLIYTDRLPISRKKKAVEKAIHLSCAECLDPRITFHMYHHDSASNPWLQVADYCCWAVHRRHEHRDRTYYDRIRPRLAADELFLWP